MLLLTNVQRPEQFPISNFQLPILRTAKDPFKINWQLKIGNRQYSPVADGLPKPSVFALRYTKSEETLVSSWIDLIAFAKSGAILSTLIFFQSHT